MKKGNRSKDDYPSVHSWNYITVEGYSMLEHGIRHVQQPVQLHDETGLLLCAAKKRSLRSGRNTGSVP